MPLHTTSGSHSYVNNFMQTKHLNLFLSATLCVIMCIVAVDDDCEYRKFIDMCPAV